MMEPARYFALMADGRPVAFFHEAAHGRRLIPQIVSGPQPFDARTLPTIAYELVPNPDCRIPEDAVPITDEEWAAYQEQE